MAAEYFAHMLARCKEFRGTILVEELDEEVAGFVTVLTKVPFDSLDDPPGDYALIADLFVDDRFRRRGVGAQLLREAERLAVSAGAQEIRVGVLDGNHSAARLYRRAGFSPYLQTMSKRLA
jgi:ribosomal protein S18 acetylase RimI-like enzyme